VPGRNSGACVLLLELIQRNCPERRNELCPTPALNDPSRADIVRFQMLCVKGIPSFERGYCTRVGLSSLGLLSWVGQTT